MDDRELLKQLAGLPRELEPANDPWDKIAARLDEAHGAVGTGQTVRPSRFARAGWVSLAAAAAAVFVVLMAWLPAGDQRPGTLPAPVLETADTASPGPAPIPAGLAGAQAEYFAQCVRAKRDPAINNAANAMRVLGLVEKAYGSQRSGRVTGV